MKRELWLNVVGVGLLVGCFVVASVQVVARAVRERDPRTITIRFSHWQLEAGLREAFEAVAREYERRNPGVRVEQIPVPGRVYAAWIRTRLAGEQPPDLMELGRGTPDEMLAQYFVPLTEHVERPNPYNVGTALEGVPWRETFVDGLASATGLETLQEYYGVPAAVVTVRMYYNRELYREIFGHERVPSTYAEFQDVCRQVREYAQRTGRVVVPVAGSRFNANILLDALFRSQTQRLSLEIDRLRLLKPLDPALVFLDGSVTLDTPAIRDALELVHEVGRDFPAGFLQLDRDDAIFYFAQGHALMLATGSWDYGSVAKQTRFSIGLFPIPLPARDDPRFGRNVLGPVSEAGQGLGVTFHLTKRSAHPQVAVDFLQFLTSRVGNQLFCDRSLWMPAVRGVEPPAETRAFAPTTEGYPDGFRIALWMWGAGEMYRLFVTHGYRLVARDGGVEDFLRALRPEFDAAVRADAERLRRACAGNVRRLDTAVAAWRMLGEAGKEAATWESQNQQEALARWLEVSLR